jgi:hypothetical protein
MRLGIMMLDPSSTLNSLKYINNAQFTPGETGDVMFQLVDLDTPTGTNTWARYMPTDAATVQATMTSNNSANTISKIASQAFPLDNSIWKFSLSSTDTTKLAGVNMKVSMTDGATVKISQGSNSIVVNPQSPYQC